MRREKGRNKPEGSAEKKEVAGTEKRKKVLQEGKLCELDGSTTDENQIFYKERSQGILTVKILNGFSSRTIKKGENLPLHLELEICDGGNFL